MTETESKGTAEALDREAEFNAQIADARAKYGRVVGWLDEVDGALIFRGPTHEELTRFIVETHGEDADQMVANENLATSCVVSMSPAAFCKILDAVPGFADEVSKRIQELTAPRGVARGDARKKLDELVAEAKKTHSRVAAEYDEEYGPFLFGPPSRPAEKQFRKSVSNMTRALAEAEAYALGCVVYPSREELAAVMAKVPGMALQFAEVIKKLSRPTGDARGKA